MTERTLEEKQVDTILTREVYEALEKIGDQGCVVSALLGGGLCTPHEKPCPSCIAKPLAAKLLSRHTALEWKNPYDDLEVYQKALLAIEGAATNTGGKKAPARRMRADIECIRTTAKEALETVSSER